MISIKYIRMDLYRMFRSKVTYVILICAVVMMLSSALITRLGATISSEMKNEITSEEEMEENKEAIEAIDTLFSGYDGEHKVFKEALGFSTGRQLLLLLTLFIVIFTVAERSHGYIKNMVGKTFFRSKLILSKYYIAVIYMLMLFLVVYISKIIAATVILGGTVDFSISVNELEVFFAQMILNMSIIALLMVIMSLFDGTAMPIVAGLLVSFSVVSLVYSGISTLVMKVFKLEDFDLEKYLPSGQFSVAVTGAEHADILKAAVIGITFFAAFELITCAVAEKKDIR